MKIGVFDSGVGGQAFVNAIKSALPETEVLLAEDKKNLPYGTKTPEQLIQLVTPILNALSIQGCDVVVVACNTVSTNIIGQLREKLTLPLIAVEPMVKPAAELTKSKVIAVCATPATLKSKRYAELKNQFAAGVKVLEPDCSDWALMIEDDEIDHEKIEKNITEVCEKGADVIVLGCTHYHWIEEEVKQIAESYKATVIQPEQAVINQLKRVLAQLS